MNFKEIFETYKNITVVGMSTNPSKPSNSVPIYLSDNNYQVVPVNPFAEEINGLKAYKDIEDVPDKIEILNVFRPSEDALEVVKKAIERKKEKGDIDVIWLQLGIVNEEAKQLAEANGITFIQDRCMYVEYVKIY